jgi:hypothetical protein
MAKVIIVKYKGSGKYIVKAEDQKALTVNEMDSDIVPNCSLNVDEISAIIAKHYFNNVLNWNRENSYILVQGQLPNNDHVFVQVLKNNSCYSD